MRFIRLDKTVLRLEPKAHLFLKEYSTNAPEAPHGAFVDLKGRIVATFDQVLLDSDTSILVIGSSFVGRLQKHLKQYLFLCDASLKLEEGLVYFDLEGSYRPREGEYRIPANSGAIVITRREMAIQVSEEEFGLFRLKHHIPVQGVDYDDEMLLNVDKEKYVSYTKGCYLGQEIIARVHYRGKPPQKLVVRSTEECGPELIRRMTSKYTDPESGKTLGFVFIKQD